MGLKLKLISDINECAEQRHLCAPGGQCRNTEGGYMCVCNRGYKLDSTGQKCIGKTNIYVHYIVDNDIFVTLLIDITFFTH